MVQLTQWVDRVFGEADPSDRTSSRLEGICGPDQRALQKLIEVFENPGTLLQPYPDEVLEQAFWDLNDTFAVVHDAGIEWALRRRFIRSFETVFRELFAVRCTRTLGHLSEDGSALNVACFMWWDFDCWNPGRERVTEDRSDAEFLESMRAVLKIDHAACQEAALHGLNHWQRARGAEVEAIIDEFLVGGRRMDERLRKYAIGARAGMML